MNHQPQTGLRFLWEHPAWTWHQQNIATVAKVGRLNTGSIRLPHLLP